MIRESGNLHPVSKNAIRTNHLPDGHLQSRWVGASWYLCDVKGSDRALRKLSKAVDGAPNIASLRTVIRVSKVPLSRNAYQKVPLDDRSNSLELDDGRANHLDCTPWHRRHPQIIALHLMFLATNVLGSLTIVRSQNRVEKGPHCLLT